MLRFLLQLHLFWGVGTAAFTALADDADTAADVPSAESQLFCRAAYQLINLLGREAVQHDLGIDAGQQASLTELNSRMQTERRAATKCRLESHTATSSDDQRQRQATRTERTERLTRYHQEITHILTPPQSARLKQIYWRDLGPVIFSDNEVGAALALTRDQRVEIARLAETLREEEARRAEERYLAEHPQPNGFVIYRATPAYKQRSMELLRELLDEAQRVKLQRLLGPPCHGAAVPVPLFEVVPVLSRCDANPRE